MASTIYEALDRNTQEIRLVTILPASPFSKTIECVVRKVTLRDAPTYIALSYTWGDPSVTAAVFIDGIERQITANLNSALRHIRDEVNPVVLWADAICINQSNTAERNHQVQLMRQIYSGVDVLAWLREEEDGSNEAIEFIRDWGPKLRELLCTDFTTKDINSFFQPGMLESVGRLLNRPWWERLWTVQVLGKEVTIMCGHKIMSWNSINIWLAVNLDFAKAEFWSLENISYYDKKTMIISFTSSNYVYKVSLRYIFQRDGALFGLLTLLDCWTAPCMSGRFYTEPQEQRLFVWKEVTGIREDRANRV
jgi:hypothetical protein